MPKPRFECKPKECRVSCCIPGAGLTLKDVARIAKAKKMRISEFCDFSIDKELKRLNIRIAPWRSNLIFTEDEKGKIIESRCIFLDPETRKCTLHDLTTQIGKERSRVKPVSGLLFPLIPVFKEGREPEINVEATIKRAKQECPLIKEELEENLRRTVNSKEYKRLVKRYWEEFNENRKVVWDALGWKNAPGKENDIEKNKEKIMKAVRKKLISLIGKENKNLVDI